MVNTSDERSVENLRKISLRKIRYDEIKSIYIYIEYISLIRINMTYNRKKENLRLTFNCGG